MLSKRDLLAGGSALLALVAAPVCADDKTAPKKQYIVQIPITFDAIGGPVVDLFIGQDGPYRFMIDTGAFGAMIREDLARKLKLSTHGTINVASLAGRSNHEYIYQARDVLMGGIFTLPTLDMVGEEKLPRAGFDGILPASILTGLPTELDYEGARARPRT